MNNDLGRSRGFTFSIHRLCQPTNHTFLNTNAGDRTFCLATKPHCTRRVMPKAQASGRPQRGNAEASAYRPTYPCALKHCHSDKQRRSMTFVQFTILTNNGGHGRSLRSGRNRRSRNSRSRRGRKILQSRRRNSRSHGSQRHTRRHDEQLSGRQLSGRTGSRERSSWGSHGDQTEQKKHSSDLHFDLRRGKAAVMSTRVVGGGGG